MKILEFWLQRMVVHDFLDSLQWPWCTEFDMSFKTCKVIFVIIALSIPGPIINIILGNDFCMLNFSIHLIPDKFHCQVVVINTEDLTSSIVTLSLGRDEHRPYRVKGSSCSKDTDRC